VHRSIRSRADEVPIEIQLGEVADAYRCHREDFDCDGDLGLDGTAVRSPIASSNPHQLARQLQECLPILRIVKLSKTGPISFCKATAISLKASNDFS
jgi:hypothetical protein